MATFQKHNFLEHDIYVKEKRIKAIEEDIVEMLRIKKKLKADVKELNKSLYGVNE